MLFHVDEPNDSTVTVQIKIMVRMQITQRYQVELLRVLVQLITFIIQTQLTGIGQLQENLLIGSTECVCFKQSIIKIDILIEKREKTSVSSIYMFIVRKIKIILIHKQKILRPYISKFNSTAVFTIEKPRDEGSAGS